MLSVAQWERETTAERTREALRHKIRNCERVGKVRFRYDLADDGRTLVPNDAEQATIRLMEELKSNGYTLRAIAAELTRRGIATKERLSNWTHSTVAYILRRNKVAA